jgi:putative hydrolase of the HAD superfamily
MNFSGFLTDLDNTLYDFSYAMEEGCKAVIRECGTGDYQELIRAFLFSSHGVESHQVIVDYLRNQNLTDHSLIDLSCQVFEKTKKKSIVPYPGVVESISRIHHAGIMIGGVTNALLVHARDRIDFIGLREYFDVLITPDMVGIRKPNPQIYLFAADTIRFPCSKICVLGDNLVNDIGPAQTLGMYGVHARYGNRLPPEFSDGIIPDKVIDSFPEIESILGIK